MTNEAPDMPIQDTAALAAITRGECESSLMLARDLPRPSLAQFKAEVLAEATDNQEVALSCGYAITKGGQQIHGPSVRLAEIVAASFPNIRTGSRIIEIGEDFVRAQGFFHDLERNVAITEEVVTSIRKRDGQRYTHDMIQTVCQATQAKAFRNCVLKGVGRWRIVPLYREIMAYARGKPDELEARRSKCMEFLTRRLGIERANVLARVNRKREEDLDLDDIAFLHKLCVAISDGEATKSEAFPPPTQSQARKSAPESDDLASAVRAKRIENGSGSGMGATTLQQVQNANSKPELDSDDQGNTQNMTHAEAAEIVAEMP